MAITDGEKQLVDAIKFNTDFVKKAEKDRRQDLKNQILDAQMADAENLNAINKLRLQNEDNVKKDGTADKRKSKETIEQTEKNIAAIKDLEKNIKLNENLVTEKQLQLDEDVRKSETKLQLEGIERLMELEEERFKNDGKTKKDEKEFRKLQKKKFQLELQMESPSKRKEMLKDQAKQDSSMLTATQRIGVGIMGLGDKIKDVATGGKMGGLLKGAGMFALFFLLPKILNSELFKNLIKFIQDKVIPAFKKLKELFMSMGEGGQLFTIILGLTALLAPNVLMMGFKAGIIALKGAFAATKAAVMFIVNTEFRKGIIMMLKGKFLTAITALKKAFMAVRVFMMKQLIPGIMAAPGVIGGKIMKAVKLLKGAFMAIRVFMMGTLVPTLIGIVSTVATALAPILIPVAIVVAIIAGIVAFFYVFKESVDNMLNVFRETGSIVETIKVGVATFIGKALSLIPALFIKLIAFVARLFGFKEFADKLPTIKELTDIVVGGILSVFDFIGDTLGKAFRFVKNKVIGILNKIPGVNIAVEDEYDQVDRDLKKMETRAKRDEIVGAKAANEAIEKRIKGRGRGRGRGLSASQIKIAEESEALELAAARQEEMQDSAYNKAVSASQSSYTAAPTIINNDSSVRSNSSNTQVNNETITPRDGMLVAATADF